LNKGGILKLNATDGEAIGVSAIFDEFNGFRKIKIID